MLDGIRAGIKVRQSHCEAIYDGGGVYFVLPSGSVRMRASKEGYTAASSPALEKDELERAGPNLTAEEIHVILTPHFSK